MDAGPAGAMVEVDARDRILDAASRLFYREGIRGVGVDRIVAEADVAKATLYNHFASKDDLVVAWLGQPQIRWIDWVRPEVERRADTPRERLVGFFEVMSEWLQDPDFRGCPFLDTASEMPDADHPARQAFRTHQRDVERFLAALAADAAHPEPALLGSQLFLVVAGAVVKALAHPSLAAQVGDQMLAAAKELLRPLDT